MKQTSRRVPALLHTDGFAFLFLLCISAVTTNWTSVLFVCVGVGIFRWPRSASSTASSTNDSYGLAGWSGCCCVYLCLHHSLICIVRLLFCVCVDGFVCVFSLSNRTMTRILSIWRTLKARWGNGLSRMLFNGRFAGGFAIFYRIILHMRIPYTHNGLIPCVQVEFSFCSPRVCFCCLSHVKVLLLINQRTEKACLLVT